MGNVFLMSGTNVSSIDQNCGNCTLMEFGSVGMIDRNVGSVTLSERNSIGVIDNNSGIVTVKASSNICKIRANIGTITIQDNCIIGIIEDNNGIIKLGNNCVVKSIIGSGGNLQWGFGSNVPQTLTERPSAPLYFYRSVNINDITRTQTYNYVQPPQSSGQSFFVNGIDMMAGTQAIASSMPQNDLQQPPLPVTQSPPNREEDESICEDLICAICMVNKKNIAFNCGHTSCDSCSGALIYCHICRQYILQKIKLYL
ncbi:hypothetical protein HA402_005241 [Bradysia odoriphaga]|nr:hypothetical protein HA402_005241 [Bradysia odoriphaga]